MREVKKLNGVRGVARTRNETPLSLRGPEAYPPLPTNARDYNHGNVVPALVLAAGQSSRMGRPKALLPCGPGQESFVERIVSRLRLGGAADVLVVGRPGDRPLREALERMPLPPRFVENPDPERGQLSSLLAGLDVADRPGVRGVLVLPVDMPDVRADTIAAVCAAFTATGAPIVRASRGGRHGHPVIFGRRLFDDLRHADPSAGAKAVLRAHEAEIIDVEVDDPGALVDFDLPEDYERRFGGKPSSAFES
jgi:molybdenum cofactor cytidylyltransferase